MEYPKDKKIILFDGVCNLCNSAVTFIIRRDKNKVFRYAALQSDIGVFLLDKYHISPKETDSIILIDVGKVYVKSSAALRISKYLKGGYPALYGFMIFPKFIRNGVYDFIANYRYKWFGKKDSCMIPTPELKSLFIDQ
ncbi:DUF393 domain-containing protein [Gangjinia marincola]|uniref:DUF393 domain-containing protein n=1 Tax=Gangjinia marincola TaxID=578463 RepID=A0ABN1MEV3_9FLAO